MWKKNPLAPKMNKDKFLRLESPQLGRRYEKNRGAWGSGSRGHLCPAFWTCSLEGSKTLGREQLRGISWQSCPSAVLQRLLYPQFDIKVADNTDSKRVVNRGVNIAQTWWIGDEESDFLLVPTTETPWPYVRVLDYGTILCGKQQAGGTARKRLSFLLAQYVGNLKEELMCSKK